MAEDPTGADDLRRAITEATAAMERHGVAYALIGGLAASFRSQPRFTRDIDFLVKVPQLTLPPLLDSHCRSCSTSFTIVVLNSTC
jgi:hypothetical protein